MLAGGVISNFISVSVRLSSVTLGKSDMISFYGLAQRNSFFICGKGLKSGYFLKLKVGLRGTYVESMLLMFYFRFDFMILVS